MRVLKQNRNSFFFQMKTTTLHSTMFEMRGAGIFSLVHIVGFYVNFSPRTLDILVRQHKQPYTA